MLNPFYRITIVASGLFVLTIFAMIASALGNTSGSPMQAAFDDHTGMILAVELLAILGSGFLAMSGDRQDPQTSETPETPVADDDQGDPRAD